MSESRRARLLGRRRFQVIRHAPPEEALEAMHEPATGPQPPIPADDVSRETSSGLSPYVMGGLPPFDPEAVAALQEEPPALSKERIARLEAITAQWAREVRIGGPGPDDTLLVPEARSLPPVPAPRPARQELPTVIPTPAPAAVANRLDGMPVPAPARVSNWSSHHDPRSLQYAAREQLGKPVPVQDLLLERGPILDQGMTPPLTVHDASACVGMAVAAAANVLELASRSEYAHTAAGLLTEEDGRRLYARAQELDDRAGNDYAGVGVLAGMKAGQEAGHWDTYLWALRGTRDIAQALLQLRSPVVIGIPWTAGMEDPDPAGVIRPEGPAAGGHSLCVVGIRRELSQRQLVAGRPGTLPGPYFVLQQSRGAAEGDGGLVYLHHTHLSRLLAGRGEAAVPLSRWPAT